MANCKLCNKEIDDNEEVCRFCGAVQNSTEDKIKNVLNKKWILIGIVIVVVLALVITATSNSRKKKEESKRVVDTSAVVTTEKESKEAVSEKLVINSVNDITNLNELLATVKDYYLTADGIALDTSEPTDDLGIRWALVSNYSSIDEVSNYISKYCTDEMTELIVSRYKVAYAPDDYLEKDGKLYWSTQIEYSKCKVNPETTELVDSFPGDIYLIKTILTVDDKEEECFLGLKIVDNVVKVNHFEYGTNDVEKLSCIFPVYTALYNYRLYFVYHNFFEFIEDDSDVFNDDEARRIYTELKGFSSVKDVENYLLQFFSKRVVDASGYFADANCFTEKDGKAYCSDAINHYMEDEGTAYDSDTYPFIQYDSIKIESISEDKSVIKVRSCIDGSEETWISTFIYENGGYKLDAVQYIFGNNIY